MSARRRRRRYESFNEGRVGPWRRSKSRERTRHFSLRLFISILLVLIPHCILLSAPVHKLQLHGKRKEKTKDFFYPARSFLARQRQQLESGSRLFLRPSETAETRKVFFTPCISCYSQYSSPLPSFCLLPPPPPPPHATRNKMWRRENSPHEEWRRRESSDGR